MASVHRDPRSLRGVWYCNFTTAEGRRVCRSTGTKSKTEAKIVCEAWAETERAAANASLSTNRAAQIINETLARHGQEPVERVRLGAWLSEWLETKTSASAQIQKRCRFACTQFLAFLGSGAERRFLDSIQERDIRSFATQLSGQGRANATVNRIIRDLGSAFNRATKLGKVRFNPIAAVEPRKEEENVPERATFTPAQVAKLVAASHGTDWAGAIILAYGSGMRLQDVANLRWSSIDLAEGIIVFRQRKTGRQTPIGIHPDFASWLERSPAFDKTQEFVFPTLAGRSGGGNRGLSNQFNAIVAQVGIDSGLIHEKRGTHGRSRRALSFHSLRHTAVSNVYNAAIVQESARRVSGHAEHGSFERYAHIDKAALRAATALIPRLPLR